MKNIFLLHEVFNTSVDKSVKIRRRIMANSTSCNKLMRFALFQGMPHANFPGRRA